MKNSQFIHNLKQKNQSNINNELNTIKYNPDVQKNYINTENKRENSKFIYTNQMWKPIIGSIDKTNIITNDFKINVENIDHYKIKSIYEIELAERLKEKKLAEILTQTYTNQNNPVNQHDTINEANINNTFCELKNSAHSILIDTNNIDSTSIIKSISNLDNLLNSIINL
jgi:hypothetical protein